MKWSDKKSEIISFIESITNFSNINNVIYYHYDEFIKNELQIDFKYKFHVRFSFDTNELFVFDYQDSTPYGSNLTKKFNRFIRKEKLKDVHLCSLK